MGRWFAAILDFLRLVSFGGRTLVEYCMTHLWLLLFPVVGMLKMAWDFARASVNFIVTQLQGVTLGTLFQVDGVPASVGDVLAFCNAFLPLDELFLVALAVFTLWQIALVVRTIKGFKETILF